MSMWLYNLLLVCVYPLVRLRLLWRARREPEYGRRVAERFGHVPEAVRESAQAPLWFHTVSAGETIAAVPLIQRFADSPGQVLVTTMTPTGSQQVSARLGGRVLHCYAPYDFLWGVRRFFDAVKPRMLVLMETELWPNLISEAHRRGVPVVLINARLSARSARGYSRIGSLTRSMLTKLGRIATQTQVHAERFVALGAPLDRVAVLGSIKFDHAAPADLVQFVQARRLMWALDGRRVWLAASTHPGEDEIVLAAHALIRERVPDATLLLVPRHPVRGPAVHALSTAQFNSVLQSSCKQPLVTPAEVIVADVMGELGHLYGLAEVSFIGGSLTPVGGHNPIEAAVTAQPMLMGPHRFNFEDVQALFTDAGCLHEVTDARTLADAVIRLLEDSGVRADQGAAAAEVASSHAGALARLDALLRAEGGA